MAQSSYDVTNLYRKQLKSQLSIITQLWGRAMRMYAHSRYAVSVRSLGIEKRLRPDHLWSCVGPYAGTKFNSIAWSAYGLSTRCRERSRKMMWRPRCRQMQLVWESSDAVVIAKCLLGHTSPLLYRKIYELYLSWQQALSLHNNACCIDDEASVDGWKMHVLPVYDTTWMFMWDCRENIGLFHKRLPLLTVQVWSKINCLDSISRTTAAWWDANVLDCRRIMLSSVFHTMQTIHGI